MVSPKTLGQTGIEIPELGLGTWQYKGGPEPLRTGLECGATFIDTAESYGTEPIVAEVIAGNRDAVFLATKVSRRHLRRRDVLQAADRSLLNLRTDHLDLYQIHEPNEEIPFEETLGALEDLVTAGKIRFIGVSNFSVAQLQRAQKALQRNLIVANQVRYSLIDRTIETDLLPYCQAHQIMVIAYSPLGREFTRLRDGDPHGVLDAIARESGHTVPQVALNWCLGHAGVVAIPKGSTREHVRDNCGASGWQLEPAQRQRLDQEIRFRRRSATEMLLRRMIPRRLGPLLKSAIQKLPASLRRRVH